MSMLTEVFPILAGFFTGLVCIPLRAPALHRMVWIILLLGFGVIATYLSGEYVESWAFILLDSAWVAGVSLVVRTVYEGYRRRVFPVA